jgi:single-strand DNA-binding protein
MSNSFVVKGNVVADGEIRHTTNGKVALTFTIADNTGFGDKQVATFWRVTLWGERGNKVAPYVLKGNPICVVGEASARPYTDKQGNEKLSLEINANDLWLIGGKDRQDAPPKQSSGGGQRSRSQDDFPDDDLPPF